MSTALWTIGNNPRRRKSRKHRSPAQRAATRKMLAANRARRNPRRAVATKRRASRRTSIRAVARRATSTVRRRASSVRRSVRRHARRATASFRGFGGGAMALVKAGAIGAGGAIVTDVAMGFVNGFLPANMNTKQNIDGTPNYLNYAVKGVLAVALGHFGKKIVSPATAHTMAAGAMTVMAYELLRPFAASVLPASMSLGYYSPAMARNPTISGLRGYQQIPGNVGSTAQRTNITALRSPMAG